MVGVVGPTRAQMSWIGGVRPFSPELLHSRRKAAGGASKNSGHRTELLPEIAVVAGFILVEQPPPACPRST